MTQPPPTSASDGHPVWEPTGGKSLRILYLTHRVPYPPNRGDRIRSYHWLQHLSKLGNVHLAALADEPVPEADRRHLEKLCRRVAIAPLWGTSRWLRGLASMACGKSATEGLFHSAELQRTVSDWARQQSFDVVIVFCSSMMPYVLGREFASSRLIVDLVDVDSQKWLDYASEAPFPAGMLYAWEGQRVRRLECDIVDRADAVVLTSRQEVAILRQFKPSDRYHAVSNGVDLEYFAPRDGGDKESGALCVFVGVLDYRANVEGLRRFCAEVWPEVRCRIPDAQFQIVGRRPGRPVMRLAQQAGVEVVGEVPDVRPYVAAAEISVAPLRMARGIQNKVLEAMAMGRPVVASRQALEGIDVEVGEHAIAVGTPGEWIDAIERLHGDPTERQRLGRSVRERIRSLYDWSSCLSPVDQLLGLKTGAAPL